MLLKSLLNVITAAKNRVFPGGWIVANRQANGVKSDSGLLFKLGYSELSTYNHKLDAIIFHDTCIKPDNAMHLRDCSDVKEFPEFTFKEFRAAVVLTAPRIDITSSEPFEKQVKVDPLSIRSEKILMNYQNTKYFKINDSLNKAHALYTSLGGKSKTKTIHYEIARNEVLHLSAKVPIKDGLGNEYTKLLSLPKPILDFCCKKYRFTFKEGKRTHEEIDASTEDMDVDNVSTPKKANTLPSGAGTRTPPVKGLSRSGAVKTPPKDKN
jgi:hypothetical protein